MFSRVSFDARSHSLTFLFFPISIIRHAAFFVYFQFSFFSLYLFLFLSRSLAKMFNGCSFVIIKNTYLVLFYCTQYNYSNISFYFIIPFFVLFYSSFMHIQTLSFVPRPYSVSSIIPLMSPFQLLQVNIFN